MKSITVKPHGKLRGTLTVPGDKSISHRAAICAALTKGKTRIRNFLFSDDCRVTLDVLKAMGVVVAASRQKKEAVLSSKGSLTRPRRALFMRESGTTARLMLGLLSAQPFASRLTAGPSLLRRPMARVLAPLRLMGARVLSSGSGSDEFLPADILPSALKGIRWRQRVASAQVKSAILLAGLFAEGRTLIQEPVASRDHTERMLRLFGADIRVTKQSVSLRPGRLTSPKNILIPGDISSASFFIVAALLAKEGRILVKDVGVNPTRMGLVRVLKRMGGRIRVKNIRNSYEPLADIEAVSSRLKGTRVRRSEVPSLIDELPVFMVAAALAQGQTVIEGAGELRVKETDRIRSMAANLRRLGARVAVRSRRQGEEVVITGVRRLKGARLRSFSDHRTAMSMLVAGLTAATPSTLDDISCISKSFPEFWSSLMSLR